MFVNWTINCFNYLDSLDKETKLLIRDRFNTMVTHFPLRFPQKHIGDKTVRICVLQPLPFIVIFDIDLEMQICTVYRVFHKKQDVKL